MLPIYWSRGWILFPLKSCWVMLISTPRWCICTLPKPEDKFLFPQSINFIHLNKRIKRLRVCVRLLKFPMCSIHIGRKYYAPASLTPGSCVHWMLSGDAEPPPWVDMWIYALPVDMFASVTTPAATGIVPSASRYNVSGGYKQEKRSCFQQLIFMWSSLCQKPLTNSVCINLL